VRLCIVIDLNDLECSINQDNHVRHLRAENDNGTYEEIQRIIQKFLIRLKKKRTNIMGGSLDLLIHTKALLTDLILPRTGVVGVFV